MESTGGPRPCASDDHPARQVGGIEVRDLAFRYAVKGPEILSGVSLSLPPRSFSALLGRSGSGKSTLLNIILGYLGPSDGSACCDGAKIQGPAVDRVAIHQEDALWPWLSVWENIALREYIRGGSRAARKHRDQAIELLHQIGLSRDLAERYPKELSVGMRKRVEIARALFARPAVLIADEPFHGLDEITRQKLHDLLLDLWHRSSFSVLFSTHDIAEALYLADRIMVLKRQLPATLSGELDNPFRGDRHALRDKAIEYSALYDRILSAMQ